MIFISHDLGIVREVADRIIIIYRGRIIESGTVDKIFSDPHEPYTRALLACRPPVSKQLKRLAVVSDYLLNDETKMASHDDTNRHEEITQPEIDRRRETLKHESSILIVKNLSVHFKIKNFFLSKAVVIKAVDEVSFEVKRGETLGLVGESGSGKSTLCNAILRLTETLGGQAIFENKNLLAVSGKDLRLMRKDIQIIFQDPYSALNPKLTVGYMIMEPMIVHRIFKNDKDQKEKALQLLSAVNLSADSFYKFPHEFSEGQRQRICIARALACNPKFLICDECVSSLDVSVQAEVLNLLISLREEFQLSCLFVSHDLSVVRFMSDRIMIMKEGRIIETGSPEEIFDHPKSGYTKHLLSAILGAK